jgi:hypothetical protein
VIGKASGPRTIASKANSSRRRPGRRVFLITGAHILALTSKPKWANARDSARPPRLIATRSPRSAIVRNSQNAVRLIFS